MELLEPLEIVQTSLPSVHSALDELFGEYRQKRDGIERIAAYVAGETDVMHYFMSGAEIEHRGVSISATNLFQPDHAIRSLDASFWSNAMLLTDVLEYMPAGKRNEWNEQIRNHKTPPFEPESVKSTLRDLLGRRHAFFAERIDGIFRALSGEHVTNSPAAFGKRMIINWMLSGYGSLNYDRVNFIHDLRSVVAKFMGRDAPHSSITHSDLDDMHRNNIYGQWRSFDGNAFRVRIYKKGTAHLEVHPDMAWRLNAVLASLYPAAIPPEFRRKPVKAKQAKEHHLEHDLVSFAVLESLASGRFNLAGNRLSFHCPIKPAAEKVLTYLGAVPEGMFAWVFDYNAHPVMAELRRTGVIPEQKSHQYYPTPSNIASFVVDIAEIEEDHDILEPSAGQAGIADFLRPEQTTCVEISPLHCKVLEGKGFAPICADFLQWQPGRLFDRIVMNPPFSDGRAVSHLAKAASLLAEGGRLVAILPASYKGKELVPGFIHQWEKTFQGEFQGTGVSITVLVLSR